MLGFKWKHQPKHKSSLWRCDSRKPPFPQSVIDKVNKRKKDETYRNKDLNLSREWGKNIRFLSLNLLKPLCRTVFGPHEWHVTFSLPEKTNLTHNSKWVFFFNKNKSVNYIFFFDLRIARSTKERAQKRSSGTETIRHNGSSGLQDEIVLRSMVWRWVVTS